MNLDLSSSSHSNWKLNRTNRGPKKVQIGFGLRPTANPQLSKKKAEHTRLIPNVLETNQPRLLDITIMDGNMFICF